MTMMATFDLEVPDIPEVLPDFLQVVLHRIWEQMNLTVLPLTLQDPLLHTALGNTSVLRQEFVVHYYRCKRREDCRRQQAKIVL